MARYPSGLFQVYFIFFSKFYLSINILFQFIFVYPQPLGCNNKHLCAMLCKSFHLSSFHCKISEDDFLLCFYALQSISNGAGHHGDPMKFRGRA